MNPDDLIEPLEHDEETEPLQPVRDVRDEQYEGARDLFDDSQVEPPQKLSHRFARYIVDWARGM